MDFQFPTTSLAAIFCLFIFSCNENVQEAPTYQTYQGKTMGTTYVIKYNDSTKRNFQPAIDSLLVAVNEELSTYINSSLISKFNQDTSEGGFILGLGKKHFQANLKRSAEIFEKTAGYFDATVMPLVNYWGFGHDGKKKVTAVDSMAIDSLLEFVGFDKITWTREKAFDRLVKEKSSIQLDFSALAKGYGVDAVGNLLSANGVQNYMVEIGGEVRAKGKNPKGEWWTIGINTPTEDANITDFQSIIQLQDIAIATSGNYRNYYQMDGKKYGHILNPKTGFQERSNLLSASVFANDCMTADAYATAFMVLGLDKAFKLATEIQSLEALFIYGTEDGGMEVKYTKRVESYLVK